MSDLKGKIDRFKSIIKDFNKLEKSVQAKIMAVADHLAPEVQGAKIAPREIRIPEPQEYPDIKTEPVPVNVKKHQLEVFADQFLKSDWKPVEKTQKDPSTTIPHQEKPTYRDYIKNPDNVSQHMQALRDHDCSKCPHLPPELRASGAMNKAEMHGSAPATSPIKQPPKNPAEPKPPMGKNRAR